MQHFSRFHVFSIANRENMRYNTPRKEEYSLEERFESRSLSNTFYISATNIREFRELLELASEQANQLNRTLHALSAFELKFKFSADGQG